MENKNRIKGIFIFIKNKFKIYIKYLKKENF